MLARGFEFLLDVVFWMMVPGFILVVVLAVAEIVHFVCDRKRDALLRQRLSDDLDRWIDKTLGGDDREHIA